MGLQHCAYFVASEPDWTLIAKAMEASTGERVQAKLIGVSGARIVSRSIGGGADISFADNRIEWEASLSSNPYFLTHLHLALVAAGAKPESTTATQSESLAFRWATMPLRHRLSYGKVGQVAIDPKA